DGTVKLWDADTWKARFTLKGHTGPVYAAAFAPDGKVLATAGEDRTVRLWEPNSGKALAVLHGHADVVGSLAFSPDGKILASATGYWTSQIANPLYRFLPSATGRNELKLWDIALGKELAALTEPTSTVLALAFSPDGRVLATGGASAAVQLWDVVAR